MDLYSWLVVTVKTAARRFEIYENEAEAMILLDSEEQKHEKDSSKSSKAVVIYGRRLMHEDRRMTRA